MAAPFLSARSRRLLALSTALPLGACAPPPATSSTPAPAVSHAPAGAALHVDGNHLVDAAGRPVQLHGVNRSGTEYVCVQGPGIFEGPSDAASISAMTSWHINAVRIPLNEDCWLGLNGVDPAYSGREYQRAVEQYVALLHQAGLAVILDLHWGAPGTVRARRMLPMPDADHAPAFWSSVASAFKSDDLVVFDLFNEPLVDSGNAATGDPWSCWLDGCTINAGNGVSTSWQSAGMQSLVNAVRGAGAGQVILAGGLKWSSDLTGWSAHRPNDPAHQTAASFHLYNFAGCNAMSCRDSQVAPVAAQVPVVTGELGENDCAGGFIDGYMRWADAHGVSYLGWTWDTWDCRSGPALITSYTGAPTAFGAALRSHLGRSARPDVPGDAGRPSHAVTYPGGRISSLTPRSKESK